MTMGDLPRVISKPWGHETIWAKTDRYVGKILHIRAGEALSLQYHSLKDETIMVLVGRIRFEASELGEPTVDREIVPGEPVHIAPGVVHRMSALDDSQVLEVSTPELEDVVRLEDKYGRM
jgi:quercetin dioxygenase-like cupin family protein